MAAGESYDKKEKISVLSSLGIAPPSPIVHDPPPQEVLPTQSEVVAIKVL